MQFALALAWPLCIYTCQCQMSPRVHSTSTSPPPHSRSCLSPVQPIKAVPHFSFFFLALASPPFMQRRSPCSPGRQQRRPGTRGRARLPCRAHGVPSSLFPRLSGPRLGKCACDRLSRRRCWWCTVVGAFDTIHSKCLLARSCMQTWRFVHTPLRNGLRRAGGSQLVRKVKEKVLS